MLFPYNTDAPIYHWPYATIGLIIVNVLAFAWECSAGLFSEDQAAIAALCLEYGNGLHPIQWLTSIFMHGDPMHLIGNMLFLWTFGLIVEGKVGWWQFLILFLGIGVSQCAVEQTIGMFLDEGYSFGASSAIFGTMAIALIWAPVNEVNAIVWLFFFIFHVELKVVTLAGFYLVLNIVTVFLTGLSMSSGLLHLMGAAIGFPIGLGLLTMRLVDCEGFDIVSVATGKEGQKIKTRQQEQEEKVAQQKFEVEKAEALQSGQQQVNHYLKQGHADMALARFNVLRNYDKSLKLTENQIYALIRCFHKAKRWRDSIPFMRQYVQLNAKHSTVIHLKMAQLFLTEFERPRLVLETLEKLDQGALSAEHRKLAQQLIAKSKWMIQEGHLEVDDQL